MKRKHKTTLRNIIVISDTHGGCRAGLCCGPVALDSGGTYTPSKAQKAVADRWGELWEEWVPRVTHGEPYGVVINGDLMDGRHHGSTTQVSQNLADQQTIAYNFLKPVAEACEGRLWIVRGTEAHCGPSGENEEMLARRLGSIPDENGLHARFELWLTVGDSLCHFTHHVGTTGSQHYEATAVLKELVEAYVEAGRNQHRPPDFIVRSHRHRCIMITIPTRKGYGIAATTPGWQLKTPFVYRIPGGRSATPQIGGLLIRQGDEEAYIRNRVWTMPVATPEEVCV